MYRNILKRNLFLRNVTANYCWSRKPFKNNYRPDRFNFLFLSKRQEYDHYKLLVISIGCRFALLLEIPAEWTANYYGTSTAHRRVSIITWRCIYRDQWDCRGSTRIDLLMAHNTSGILKFVNNKNITKYSKDPKIHGFSMTLKSQLWKW